MERNKGFFRGSGTIGYLDAMMLPKVSRWWYEFLAVLLLSLEVQWPKQKKDTA